MPGKLQFDLAAYQEAAHKYRPELLMLPIIGIKDTLKFMTARPGIRYKESVAAVNGTAQFGPYKPSRSTDFNLKGDGQMKAPTALHVLRLIALSLSEHLNDAIWKGVRNPEGDTSLDLFDGFDTITQKEITAGKIAAGQGNYKKLTEAITSDNACDIAKEILRSLDPRLRAQDLYMYCSQEFADMYNDSYQASHAGLIYNEKYDQLTVEGSNNRLHIVPMYNKADSKFIHICPKVNMLVGYDQMSDAEDVLVKEYEPFILSYIATMFFGVQFESIDKRRLMVVELAD